jgi:thiosulfate/3-mercaptopyruvate sulfurtransferase
MTLALPDLVSARWLAEHAGDVVIADVRWYLDGRSGREAFAGGHLPGAVFVDLDRDLSAPAAPGRGRHPLPAPGALASALGRLGIAHGQPVVAYDDAGGSIAARLWWMLHALGEPVAVLDGGLQAWPSGLEAGPGPARPVVTREVRAWPAAAFVGTDDVDRLRQMPAALLLDARSAGRFSGDELAVDPRPGHIPGARSAPWAENLDPRTGRFKPAEELARRFSELGAAAADVVVTTCGSGVTACHDLLALHVAGYDRLALYAGSWSAWSGDPRRPAALGP